MWVCLASLYREDSQKIGLHYIESKVVLATSQGKQAAVHAHTAICTKLTEGRHGT